MAEEELPPDTGWPTKDLDIECGTYHTYNIVKTYRATWTVTYDAPPWNNPQEQIAVTNAAATAFATGMGDATNNNAAEVSALLKANGLLHNNCLDCIRPPLAAQPCDKEITTKVVGVAEPAAGSWAAGVNNSNVVTYNATFEFTVEVKIKCSSADCPTLN